MKNELTEETKAIVCDWLGEYNRYISKIGVYSLIEFKQENNLLPKPKLEFNRWIKDDENPEWMVFLSGNSVHYGFNNREFFYYENVNNNNLINFFNRSGHYSYAIEEEILEGLSKIAVEKGYVEGVKVHSFIHDKVVTCLNVSDKTEYIGGDLNKLHYGSENGMFAVIMKDGKWAEILPSNQKEIDEINAKIKALKKRRKELENK